MLSLDHSSVAIYIFVFLLHSLFATQDKRDSLSPSFCVALVSIMSYTAFLSSSVPYEYPHTPPFPLGGIDALPNSGRPRSLYSVRLLRILGLTVHLKSELPRVGLQTDNNT